MSTPEPAVIIPSMKLRFYLPMQEQQEQDSLTAAHNACSERNLTVQQKTVYTPFMLFATSLDYTFIV